MSSIPEQLENTSVEPEPKYGSDFDCDEKTSPRPSGEELVVEDLLVEDVSIDGMCGVY